MTYQIKYLGKQYYNYVYSDSDIFLKVTTDLKMIN